MFFNPIIAMIHDAVAERWHPVIFEESHLPGPPTPDKPIRHKSKGHHTTGFGTKAEADENAKTDLAEKIPGVRLELDTVFEWDGEGIPTIVHFFQKV